MSDKRDSVCEIKFKLENYSNRLGISVDELIDRYIRKELYMDEYYEKYPSRVLENERRNAIEDLKRKTKKNKTSKNRKPFTIRNRKRDEKIVFDEDAKSKLENYSSRLGISVDELIDRYIRKGLYMEDYYEKYPSRVLENERRKAIEDLKRKAQKNRNLKKEEKHSQKSSNRINSGTGRIRDIDEEIRRFSMYFHYEIKNEKLRGMVEEKAKKLNISVDKLIWMYVNRGLLNDTIRKFELEEFHANGFLEEVNEILGLEEY